MCGVIERVIVDVSSQQRPLPVVDKKIDSIDDILFQIKREVANTNGTIFRDIDRLTATEQFSSVLIRNNPFDRAAGIGLKCIIDNP